MTETYRRVLPAASRAFVQDGEIHLFGIPKWVTRAWVIATATAQEPVAACVDAHLGAGAFAQFGSRPEWGGRELGRAWARRLAELDQQTRAQAHRSPEEE